MPEQATVPGCSKCPRYSYQLQRCLDGYVNPTKGTLKENADATIAGLLKPCPFTKRGQRVTQLAFKQLREASHPKGE